MYSELDHILGLKTDYLPNSVILLSDDFDSDGSFILTHYISKYLKSNGNVLLINNLHGFNHYHQICLKFGLNLKSLRESGQFCNIDLLKRCYDETTSSQGLENQSSQGLENKSSQGLENKSSQGLENKSSQGLENKSSQGLENKSSQGLENKSSQGLENKISQGLKTKKSNSKNETLKELYFEIRKAVQTLNATNENILIVIDNLTTFINLDYNHKDVINFVNYCSSLTADDKNSLLIRATVSSDDLDEDLFAFKATYHRANVRVKLAGLSTGFSRDVIGNMEVDFDTEVDSRLYQYNFQNFKLKLFPYGSMNTIL